MGHITIKGARLKNIEIHDNERKPRPRNINNGPWYDRGKKLHTAPLKCNIEIVGLHKYYLRTYR